MGRLIKNDTDLKYFLKIFNELFVIKDLVKGNRIYIPSSLRKKILNAAHEGHQVIVKIKHLLKSKTWYPQMDREVELLIQNCLPCQAATLKNCQEPLKMTELPSGLWEHVAVDFKEPLHSVDYLLAVIDEYQNLLKLKSQNQPQ